MRKYILDHFKPRSIYGGGKAKPFAYAPPFTKVEEIIV